MRLAAPSGTASVGWVERSETHVGHLERGRSVSGIRPFDQLDRRSSFSFPVNDRRKREGWVQPGARGSCISVRMKTANRLGLAPVRPSRSPQLTGRNRRKTGKRRNLSLQQRRSLRATVPTQRPSPLRSARRSRHRHSRAC